MNDVADHVDLTRATYGEKAEELPERTNEAAGQYAQACETVAQETGVRSINLWSIFQSTPNWEQKFLWYVAASVSVHVQSYVGM